MVLLAHILNGMSFIPTADIRSERACCSGVYVMVLLYPCVPLHVLGYRVTTLPPAEARI